MAQNRWKRQFPLNKSKQDNALTHEVIMKMIMMLMVKTAYNEWEIHYFLKNNVLLAGLNYI